MCMLPVLLSASRSLSQHTAQPREVVALFSFMLQERVPNCKDPGRALCSVPATAAWGFPVASPRLGSGVDTSSSTQADTSARSPLSTTKMGKHVGEILPPAVRISPYFKPPRLSHWVGGSMWITTTEQTAQMHLLTRRQQTELRLGRAGCTVGSRETQRKVEGFVAEMKV